MLVEALYDTLETRVPAEDIVGIAFDPASEREWMPECEWHERLGNKGDRRFAGKLVQLFAVLICAAIATSRLFLPLKHLLPKDQRSAVSALESARVAISCPGGYLEDSNRAYFLNLLQMLVARRLSAKVVLAPQSIGPVRSRLGRLALSFTLRRMDLIYVREQRSAVFIRNELGIQNLDIRRSGDLAFWHSRRSPDGLAFEWEKLGVDPRKPIIGVTVVAWNFPGHADPRAAQHAYISALADLVNKVADEGTHQVVLFNQVSFDLPVAESLARKCPSLIIDRDERDAALFASMIAQCDAFIGSRFHSCVFSLLGHLPTLAIAYLPKTEGIMIDLGLEEYSVPITSVTSDDLLRRFRHLMKHRESIGTRIAASVESYRKTQGQFIADMPSWL